MAIPCNSVIILLVKSISSVLGGTVTFMYALNYISA